MKIIPYINLEEKEEKHYFEGEMFTGIAEAKNEDGSKYYEYRYKDGLLHGPTVKWLEDGSISHVIIYQEGKRKEIKFPHQLNEKEIESYNRRQTGQIQSS